MSQTETSNKRSNVISFLSGLCGISIIIIVHELGHFLAAHMFHVPTPRFSIGFGPSLFEIPIGNTIFQLALLPIGGYVEINQEVLALQPYMHKIIILGAGIFFNILFSFIIMSYYGASKTKNISVNDCFLYIQEQRKGSGAFIGPIGLIQLIGNSFSLSKQLFFIIVSIVSANIALFNLLPLPFLDGGQMLFFTIQTFMNAMG